VTPEEAKRLNSLGPCPSCGTELAIDQRYCAECGERLVLPLSMPYAAPPLHAPNRFGLPMPLRVASTLALATLVFGVVVGTAMSTALSEHPAPPPPILAQAPPPPPPKDKAEPVAPAPAPEPPAPVASSFGSAYAPGVQPTGAAKTPKPEPQIISGTVVHVNPVAGSYALAQGGPLVAVHARGLPRPGDRVQTPVRTLLNGTYAEDGKRKTRGRAGGATFSGTVTFRDDAAGRDYYTVSSTGSSVLVRVPPNAAGTATPPDFASSVTVTVRFDAPGSSTTPAPPPPASTDGATPPATTTTTTTTPQPTPQACDSDGEAGAAGPKASPEASLTETRRSVSQSTVSSASLEGIVQAVCPGSRQLVLSADDIRESERDSVLGVAQGIDLSRLRPGQPITATVELKPPDVISLGSLASDQGMKGASDSSQVQGGASTTGTGTTP
jgi:hypothetical protein